MKLQFFQQNFFFTNSQMSNFTKISPVTFHNFVKNA